MPKKSSIDRQFGIKIHSSFSGSRFKISRKGGSPAPSPLNKCETFQVMILLIDCLLPAITFTGHHLILQFIDRSETEYLPNDFSPYNLRITRRLHHIFSCVCLLLSRQFVQCLCVRHYLTGTQYLVYFISRLLMTTPASSILLLRHCCAVWPSPTLLFSLVAQEPRRIDKKK